MSPPEQHPPSLAQPLHSGCVVTPFPSVWAVQGNGDPPAHAGGGTSTSTWQKSGLGGAGKGTAVLLAHLVAGEGGPWWHRTWQALHQLQGTRTSC